MSLEQGLELLVTFIGIYVVLYGIDSWRREHVGVRKIELAEETLALFYEAADAIRHMRYPIAWGTESDDVQRAENESEKAFTARKTASVAFKRYNDHQEMFNKLHSMRYRFMAQVGKDASVPFNELREIVNRITLSARSLARLWAQDHFRTEEAMDEHQKKVEKHEAVFWEGSDDDEINIQLNLAIQKIEATCKTIIEGKGTVYGILNYRFWDRS